MKSNFERIYASIPDNVKLIAVSKTKPIELLQEAYELEKEILEKTEFRK